MRLGTLVLVAAGACSRPAKPLSLVVSAIAHATPPDAGLWEARVLASKATTDPAAVTAVTATIADARKRGPLLRCTFLEGGEPSGLKFELSDRSKIYVYPDHDAGKAIGGEGCWDLDAPAAARLRTLAENIGVTSPAP